MNYFASRWISQSVDSAVTLAVALPLVALSLSAAGILNSQTLINSGPMFWVGILFTIAACSFLYRTFCTLFFGGSLGQIWSTRRGMLPGSSLKTYREHFWASFFPAFPILWAIDLFKAARRSARKSSF